MSFPGPPPKPPCADCGAPSFQRGLCRPCYREYAAQGWEMPLKPWAVNRTQHGTTCTLPQCDRPARTVGLCHSHYMRKLRGLPLDTVIARHDLESTYLDDDYSRRP